VSRPLAARSAEFPCPSRSTNAAVLMQPPIVALWFADILNRLRRNRPRVEYGKDGLTRMATESATVSGCIAG